MSKKILKLNESTLNRLISEMVKEVLNNGNYHNRLYNPTDDEKDAYDWYEMSRLGGASMPKGYDDEWNKNYWNGEPEYMDAARASSNLRGMIKSKALKRCQNDASWREYDDMKANGMMNESRLDRIIAKNIRRVLS